MKIGVGIRLSGRNNSVKVPAKVEAGGNIVTVSCEKFLLWNAAVGDYGTVQ